MLVSENITCTSAYSSLGCSRPLFGSYTGSESSFTSISKRKSLNLVKDKTRFSGSKCCFSVALVTKKHRYFPGICDAAGGKAATLPTPGRCFQRNSTFLYSLLKSAAKAVLKLMSAVIAIAHVLFVSMKSLSVNIMFLEYSFGRLKYDSTTLPFYVIRLFLLLNLLFLLLFSIFLFIRFSVWVSPTPTLRTKLSFDVPVDRIPDIKSRLEAGMSSCLSWAAQEGSSRSVLMYFALSRSTS